MALNSMACIKSLKRFKNETLQQSWKFKNVSRSKRVVKAVFVIRKRLAIHDRAVGQVYSES
jgi:hypothetical protein